MASIVDSLTERDMKTLAGITGSTPDELRADLRRRPWAINDLLAREDVFEQVMDRCAHPADVVSPYLLFSVLAHRAAAELREATFMNDWAGPKTRLPVFDIEPIQEFLTDPGRITFLVKLLDSFVAPEPPPIPGMDPLDLVGMAKWVDLALPADRVALLRRLGDLALFLAGVFPDRVGTVPFRPVDAERMGKSLDLKAEDILALCSSVSLAPGLAAFDTLGSRCYSAAFTDGAIPLPPVVSDVASRFSSARRVLNHLSDRYLHHIEPGFGIAA